MRPVFWGIEIRPKPNPDMNCMAAQSYQISCITILNRKENSFFGRGLASLMCHSSRIKLSGALSFQVARGGAGGQRWQHRRTPMNPRRLQRLLSIWSGKWWLMSRVKPRSSNGLSIELRWCCCCCCWCCCCCCCCWRRKMASSRLGRADDTSQFRNDCAQIVARDFFNKVLISLG